MDPTLEHLLARGLARSADGVVITPLRPGVQAAEGPGLDVVVKASGTEVEAEALRLVRTLVPGTVPPVLDSRSGYLVLTRAPHDWTNCDEDLAAGVIDIEVARRLGWILGRLQRRTAVSPEAAGFADRSAFERLRLSPFHHAVRDRYPELADAVSSTLRTMASTSACLVHGALEPSNMLVSPPPGPGITLGARRLWVLDWDAVHFGDPTFDPATAIATALVGTVYQPELASRYAACAQAFLHALAAERAELPTLDPDQLGRQVGCLLVVAADEKELPAQGEQQLRGLGRTLLLDPPAGITDAWKRLS
jgi:uncharacterized protein YdhG (YjbR/CyaY superfamily)